MSTNARAYDNRPNPSIGLHIKPAAGRIGGIVEGVRLSPDLDANTIAAIKAALVHHKVLFLRGQGHLDDSTHEAFAARLGELQAHPTVPVAAGRSILELNSNDGARANVWHTDVSFIPAYPCASVLRGVVIPEAGGDTIWANAEAAYDDLPDALKDLACGLRAIHSNRFDYAISGKSLTAYQKREHQQIFAATIYQTEHPLVRVHPDSGRRSLLLGSFFKQFIGLSAQESLKLFEIFQDYITKPENTVRWHWSEGDVAIWDNRATQHYAVADYGSLHRVVHRVTLKGEVPAGVDGKPSRLITPAAGENGEPAS